MKTSLVVTFSAGLTLVSAAIGAQPQSVVEPTGVTGYVLAPDGAPVSAGTVVMPAATAVIDRAGRFRLVPTGPGIFQMTVSAPGFAPYRMMVTVPRSRSLRLPVIRLAPGAYFRVRLVSPRGDPIPTPQVRRLSFDPGGTLLNGALGDSTVDGPDADGAITLGPLPRGVTTVAVDLPGFAQTRLADLNVGGQAGTIDGGTVVVQQPGAMLHVNVVDDTGAPVPDHYVDIEDVRPRSPLMFRPVRTDGQGRATFDRLAGGRYRVRTTAARRCGNVPLTVAQFVDVSGAGTIETRLIAGGTAALRFASALGPAAGLDVWASPNVPPPSSLLRSSSTASPPCRGVTDADGRLTLPNFPPGPARVDLRMANSTFQRQLDVPSDGRELAIAIPDGFLPVHVVNGATGQPIGGARITWTGGGGRVDAVSTATGDALLEAVGNAGGTLAAAMQGFEPATVQVTEVPGTPTVVALAPTPVPANFSVRVNAGSGEPLPGAVVEIVSADPSAIPRVGVTDTSGAVPFRDVPAGAVRILASADGFASSMAIVDPQAGAGAVMTLARGYRVTAAVDLPATAGGQTVSVLNEAGSSMDLVLDGDSDRRIDPPARLSVGPLATGAYVIELTGGGGRRQERVQIVDRDVSVTIR